MALATRTKTARSSYLDEAASEAYLDIHEDDASNLKIVNGEFVEVVSPRGAIQLPARLNKSVRKGTVFIPFHFGDWVGEEVPNDLTVDVVDPVSHQPVYKNSVCRLEKIRTSHKARKGEKLTSIAEKYHLPPEKLAQANGLDRHRQLDDDMILEIPKKVKEVQISNYRIPVE
ncbi:molybdopterin dinucleotide binding domain-containing protein [Bacillus sp. Marseille-Q3570]|uniref:molybdopterin dinucleotide binding domain-containing protein n=1 Tax=Bacillus sp. Marseille-Q3570 TaxID=2963522 RepID=UPI0021B70717|nr:molybdopterin dinucleotide binding domain-containing protein [Bacillus sp. Marseille-Q3570]